MAAKRLVIIDGKSVFYRGYYAMPNLATASGQPTGGVYGFAMLALRILKIFDPDYVIVAWDKSKTNIRARRKLYADYKAGRKPMPLDLKEQIPILRQMLEGFHWPLLETDDFEADDIMATLARQAQKQGIETTLVTSDLDVLQAVDGGVTVCALKKGLTNVVMYDRSKFTAEYGLTPDQFIDYKALKGDSSDNVPGVGGIGDKTARDLVQKFGSLEGVYKHLDEVAPSLRAKLERDRDMAFLSHKLLVIRFDAPVKLELEAAATKQSEPAAIAELFKKLQFRRLLTELPEDMRLSPEAVFHPEAAAVAKPASTQLAEVQFTELKTPAEVAKLKLGKEVVLVTRTSLSDASRLPEITQVIASPQPGRAYSLNSIAVWAALLPKLESTKLIGHDLKTQLKAWGWYEPKDLFDTLMAGFIIDPLVPSQPTLVELAARFLNVELVGDQPSLLEETRGPEVSAIWQLYQHLTKALTSKPKLKKLAEAIEFPLIPVLAKMESFGVKIDVLYLGRMAKDLSARIEDVKKMIFNEAKEEFNISSPAQLANILFTRLSLPTKDIKKLKTGYSTAAGELEKLRGLHPVINLISEYRELTKLKNTYVDVLPTLIDQNGRLHTTFNQAVAQTGRLSSDKPNLQNIPIRTEVGREIRKAFVADPESVLVAADYSQFELRLAAVLAEDTNMIHAFNKGIDIHAMTAVDIYDLDDVEMVTHDQRRAAKTINFGVLYGLSPHGLSQATGMTHEQAKDFIDKYFGLRQKLLTYLENLRKQAHEAGYVETMFGRRRPTPDVRSSNWVVRQAAERAAINMPIQGTAADIMKMAMIALDKKLDKDCHQLLQIHDSILVECPRASANRVAKVLKDTMENVHKLPVKLAVDVKVGSTWGDL